MNFGFSGRLFRVCAVMFAFVAFAAFAAAQSTTDGAIGGTVYDPQGAVVPNAKVTVHNDATNAEETAETDTSGNYRVTRLQPALYTVTVAAGSFAPYKAERVLVEVGTVTTLSPHMALGGANETVDVSGEAPAINTSSPDFAPVVNQMAIENLPLNGGRWSDFTLMTPGVLNNGSGFGLVSVAGQSVLLNNNTVDGADNNQAFFSEERGRTRIGYSSPREAIEEFQVNTSNYSAEYGRAAGAVVNTVTKSGSNTIHGTGYFYDRDNDWGAINPFTTITVPVAQASCANPNNGFCTVPYKPTNKRKMTGFGAGGPIIKNKLFWYLAFDRYILHYPGTAVPGSPGTFFAAPSASTVSTLATRLGVSQTQATTVYNNDLNSLLSVMGPVPRTGDSTIWFPKVDWQINDKNHASIELNRMRWWSPAGIQTQATNQLGIASFGNDYVKDTWLVAKYDTVFAPTLTNEFRYQWGRDFEFENPQQASAYEQNNILTNAAVAPGYQNPLGSAPNVTLVSTSIFAIGTPTFLTRPAFPDERSNQFSDTVTKVWGNHVFKAGADVRHVNDISQNLRTQFGSYSYTSLLNYFSDLNVVNSCGGVECYSSYSQAFGPLGFKFNTDDLGFFVQDDWKFKPRLTLNLGVRYDYEMLPSPILANPAVPQTQSFPNDTNNIGPRVGFAYDLTGDGKTSLRGGAGMFYGRIINSAIYNAMISTGMPGGQISCPSWFPTSAAAGSPNAVCGQSPVRFPEILNPALLPPGTTSNLSFYDKKFQAPEIEEVDFSLEHEFAYKLVGSVSYLGRFGKQLPNFVDVNLPAAAGNITYQVIPGGALGSLTSYTTPLYSGKRPCATGGSGTEIGGIACPAGNFTGALTDINSGSTSNYNALVGEVKKRFSDHLQFDANFTWSHALDFNAADETTFTDTNDYYDPFNIRADKGNSVYDVPLRFVFNAIVETPWHSSNKVLGYLVNGWQVSPIYQWQNGLPYSVGTSGSAPGGFAPVSSGINGSGGAFRIGSTGRNTFRVPNTAVLDLGMSKNFVIHERLTLELSGQAFNLFNHINATSVSSTGYAVQTTNVGTTVCSVAAPCLNPIPSFGTVTNANSNFAYSQREIQIGIRLKF